MGLHNPLKTKCKFENYWGRNDNCDRVYQLHGKGHGALDLDITEGCPVNHVNTDLVEKAQKV